MKRFLMLFLLNLSLITLSVPVRADVTTIVDFEEFASLIGNDRAAANFTFYENNLNGVVGTKDVSTPSYDSYLPNVSYTVGGVGFNYSSTDDGGGGMAYWQGIVLTTRTTVPPFGSGTDNYLENQYVSNTGSGADGSNVYAIVYGPSDAGVPYDSPSLPSISLPTDAIIKSIDIANTPWTVFSMTEGDWVASPLNDMPGSYFKLLIYGVGADGQLLDTQEVNLGSYSEGVLEDWLHIDLSDLAGAIELHFAFEEYSNGSYSQWANYPTYFAFDNLTYTTTDTNAPTPEPATMLIFGLGLAGLGIVRRRMKK